MSPIILALEVISYSTSTSPWGRPHGHGTRGTQMKGCYYFINEILLNILEVNQDFMPPNQDQNIRPNFYILPSIVLSSSEAFYAFDDNGGDNLEAVFAHMCISQQESFLPQQSRKNIIFIELRYKFSPSEP